jgi:hypothetical protein
MRARPHPAVRFTLVAALLPPLAQSPGLTSGFGEYREGRFHAGIDYSTESRVGAPVRAIADGHVERVRASGVGYGRAIYLRLRDGRTAVYGHLSRFAPALDAWVTAKQESSGRYEQDLEPAAGAFPFRQGEVIAWSGESGAGPPHLHLELRRGDMNLHPITQGGIVVADRTPPSITAVTILPAGARTRVGGSFDSWRGTLRGAADLEGPVVTGPFRLALDTYDRSGDRPNHVGTYRLQAELDGAPAFEAVLDSMSWDEMPIADRIYDLAATQRGMRDRRLLQSTPGDRTGLVRRGVPVWSLTPGTHRIEFIAEDEAGNVTTRALRLVVADPDSLPARAASGASRLVAQVRPGRPAFDLRDLNVLIATRAGEERPPFATWDGLELVDSVRSAAGTTWSLALVRDTDAGDRRFLRVPGGASGVDLGAAGGPDGEVTLSWDSLAFHEPAAFMVVEETFLGAPGDGLVPVTRRAVAIEPSELALARAVKVAWSVPGGPGRRGVGLFRRGTSGWSLLAAADSAGVVRATTRRLGTFALLADTTGPRLVPPRRYAARAGLVPGAFSVRVSDPGSGLVAAEQRVLLDGRAVPAEYDSEAGRLTWRPRVPLSPGAHAIVVEAVDALGNRASVRVPVEVR